MHTPVEQPLLSTGTKLTDRKGAPPQGRRGAMITPAAVGVVSAGGPSEQRMLLPHESEEQLLGERRYQPKEASGYETP